MKSTGGRSTRASTSRSVAVDSAGRMKPDRLNALTDGVVAIAITIIVLELPLPPEPTFAGFGRCRRCCSPTC